MKKIIIISTVLAFCSFLAKSQEKSLEQVMELNMPASIESPTPQKLQTFMQRHKKSKIDLKSNKGKIYTTGDVIIQVNGGSAKVPADLLESRKIFYDDYNKQIITQKNYSSVIKIINNCKVLMINYDRLNDYSYYLIYGVNNNINDKAFAIRIEYKKEDSAKVNKIVAHILNKIRFK